MKLISKEKLKELIDKNKKSYIIDVLSFEEFQKKHIKGSVNIPIESENFKEILLDTIENKDSKIVIYSENTSCMKAVTAAKEAVNLGYTKVNYFEEGIEEWEESGLPLTQEMP